MEPPRLRDRQQSSRWRIQAQDDRVDLVQLLKRGVTVNRPRHPNTVAGTPVAPDGRRCGLPPAAPHEGSSGHRHLGLVQTSRSQDQRPNQSSPASSTGSELRSGPMHLNGSVHHYWASTHRETLVRHDLDCERIRGCPTGRCACVPVAARACEDYPLPLPHGGLPASQQWLVQRYLSTASKWQ